MLYAFGSLNQRKSLHMNESMTVRPAVVEWAFDPGVFIENLNRNLSSQFGNTLPAHPDAVDRVESAIRDALNGLTEDEHCEVEKYLAICHPSGAYMVSIKGVNHKFVKAR